MVSGRIQLSVNVNKYALVRNSRGRNTPDLLAMCDLCLASGAHGITIHPRTDERHVRFDDVPAIAAHLASKHPGVELNIECEPNERILDLVFAARPAQCTLVPVRPGEVTSDHGWRFDEDGERLAPVVRALKDAGIRVSAFVDCDDADVSIARELGVDRVELYTGPFAWAFGGPEGPARTADVFRTAERAVRAGLEVNAGHDLDRFNLGALRGLPGLREVSIGHALVCRALEVGTPTSIRELLAALGEVA